ncbi:hypothetical protein NEDG_01850 [Nematocida displodere]|uniref:Uncharacterized protein n=1 Tax=Nematocida displodere TaxID=1805483 RepID=A0A177EH94_9MICR|nr:hypothetical protein NEDG_01850 [Nematocida displodere]
METATRVLSGAIAVMTEADTRMVSACFVSYLFGIITPHVSNHFFIREIFNCFTGFIVLAALYNQKNVAIIGCSVLLNLCLSFVLGKEKKKRGRVAVYVNLCYILLAYLVFDRADNNPFITLTALFMKYFYVATEYLPQTHGIMAYFGYILFTPGLRYGPVMSFGEYGKWLSRGYIYLLEGVDKAVVQKEIGSEKNERKVTEIKEGIVVREYTHIIAYSACKFAAALVYLIAHKKIEALCNKLCQIAPPFCAIPMMVVLCSVGKCFVICRWWTEEASYLMAFVPKMRSVDLKKNLFSRELSEMCASWNEQGSKFMHHMIGAFLDNTDANTNAENIEKPESTEKPENYLIEYISTSILSYGHLLLFPSSLGGLALSLISIFTMALIPDHLTDIQTSNGFAIRFSSFLASKYLFAYFMLGMFTSPTTTITLWRYSLYLGQFLVISEIVKLLGIRERQHDNPTTPELSTPDTNEDLNPEAVPE